MEIIELQMNNERWDLFLEKYPHLIFHIPQYKQFVESAFDCEYIIYAAVEDNEIKTILPVVSIRSSIFGNKLISSAYIEYGGFAGDDNYVKAMLDFLNEKYKEENDYLEIRDGLEKFDGILSSTLKKENLYKRFVLDLRNLPSSTGDIFNIETKNDEKLYSNFGNVEFSSGSIPAVKWFRSNIQKSKRKAIKKAKKEKEEGNVVVKDVPEKDLDEFYHLYCRNMRRFGSPPYNKNYFIHFYEKIINNNVGKLYGSYYQGKLAAALLGFAYQDRVHILIAVSDKKYQEYRLNDAVHSEFIEWSIENNFRYFDFGRVREDSGQFEYKKKWGPNLYDLPSYFMLWKAEEIPFTDPQKHKNLVKIWKKMPLWLTRVMGMKLRREIGI